MIPLPLIPLPVPGLAKKKKAGQKMEAIKFLVFIFLPHLFALAFAVALVAVARAGLYHALFSIHGTMMA